ncbi:MAG TPA: elongation factor P [Candidatus Hydrogenedentes bacterium]|nr:elongation factor P [Candidatus Hydrogenedentota bacterium]HQH53204.1 elongation factor P [Candidatus Hydrogenedentota bacterium]
MISTADFRNGIVIIENGELMELVDFQHVKPGKGGAFVRTKQKNVVTGRVIEKTYRAGEKFEEARLLETPFQYLYNDGDLYYFMDHETFEQIPVGPKIVGDKSDWLKENEEVSLLMYEGKVIALNLPITVTLKITRCDPGVQGDRASGGTKPATVETGAAIQVPLFVNEGDTVKIDTRTGQYIERVSTQ